MVKRMIDILNGLVKWILIIDFAILTVVVFLQVLFRFVLNQPLAWTEEMARYLLVWLTFLGASYGVIIKAHPTISIVYDRLGNIGKKIIMILSLVLTLFFFYEIFMNSLEFIERSMYQKSPVLQVPMGAVYMAIPVASIHFVINILYMTVLNWKREVKT